LKLALDATYSLGSNLSGVGIYSRELLRSLAALHPQQQFEWRFRPHRYFRSFSEELPENARRRLLLEGLGSRGGIFHGLNQRLPGKRFAKQVATFHDLFVMTAEYSTPEFRARFTEQARRAAGEADRIIAVSQFTANQVRDLLGVEESRIRVVHHGIQKLPVAKRAPEKIVLHVGAIQERKNIGRLVKAFEAMPEDWKLVLAGSAGFGAEAIMNAIEESARRPDIWVLGYVANDELAGWYGRASIFAFPSLDEGFGMPVLEAMRAGVAVVASNRSAVPEVCGDAAELVDAEDMDAWSETLTRLATDQERRGILERKGRRRAEEFSWALAAQGTWAVYAELN
jgi:glycosyltransferase involved in cell wall biosynthesis